MAAETDLSWLLLAGSEPVFDIVCIPCNSEGKHLEAEGYCMDCCEHLCAQCLNYHRTLSALKHHKLVDKENMPLDQIVSVGKDRCTELCNSHKGKVIEYFCPTHKVLGCNVCVALNHKQCEDVAYIPEVSAGLEKSHAYKTFKKHLFQLIQKSDMICKSAEQNLKASAEVYSRVQRDICAFRQEINTALDKLETDMKEKLEQVNTENIEALQAVSREASKVDDELLAMSADFQELINKKQNCKIFTQMKSTESELLTLHDTLEKMNGIDFNIFKFQPSEKLLQMLKGADVLGELSVRTTSISKLRADHVADIKIPFKNNWYCPDLTGVTVVSREKLVVIDKMYNRVHLIDSFNNKITSQLQLEQLPWTVTAITKDKVAVTQPRAKKILFLTCDKKLVVDTAVRVQGECYGIAYYQNKLIVTFRYPGKLQILSMTGEVLQRFEKDDQGTQLLSEPWYVSVDPQEPAIFVSDRGNDSLIKLSMDGKVMAVYTDDELSEPRQCTVDQAGLVYLCGEGSYNIHLLTSECTKLKTILTQSDDMKCPQSISYCEATRRLYVGLWRNDSIKVYQLHD